MKDITVILPRHNEQYEIENTIKMFLSIGLCKILVVDDCSIDNTKVIAEKSGAEVISSSKVLGLNMSVLKGLYYCRTQDALIYYPIDEFSSDIKKEIIGMIEFARMGNYAMFISNAPADYPIKLSSVLKKRFGLFLPEPGFEIVFLNSKIIQIIKSSSSSTDINIFFEAIKEIIKNNLKLGVYPIYSHYIRPIWMSISNPKISLRRRYKNYLRRRKNESLAYFEYAFPDIEKTKTILTILSLFVGAILLKLFELLIGFF